MGIGNTTASAAICHALYGGEAADWVGPGTGVEGDALTNKIRVVKESVILHKAVLTDGLEILRCFGGREMAAICGAIISARFSRIPVLLDGYVTCAAAAVLHAMDEHALDHCVVAHVSAEPGHRRLLEKLGKIPLFDFGMRLGEGSGAALAIGILRSAVACHTGMATFEEAAVSNKD
jgi:nicotinate-nucleotide--dimethylbenzimidazole phosphoribosyltransferase